MNDERINTIHIPTFEAFLKYGSARKSGSTGVHMNRSPSFFTAAAATTDGKQTNKQTMTGGCGLMCERSCIICTSLEGVSNKPGSGAIRALENLTDFPPVWLSLLHHELAQAFWGGGADDC